MRNAALFVASQSEAAEAGILHSILNASRRVLKGLQDRRQVARLTEFDDHMLADIGLSRRDVKEALDLPFSYDPGVELQLRAHRNVRAGWNV